MINDINLINNIDIEDVMHISNNTNILKNIDLDKMDILVKYLIENNPKNSKELQNLIIQIRKKVRINPNNKKILHYYKKLVCENSYYKNKMLEILLTPNNNRIASGVLVITLFTSPKPSYTDKDGNLKIQKFSCGENCAYCPMETEIRLNCTIESIELKQYNDKIGIYEDHYELFIKSKECIEDVRVITYIVSDSEKLYCRHYDEFNDNDRTFKVYMKPKFGIKLLSDNKDITCVKVEQARSYISTEDGVRRANQSNYDCKLQFFDRASTYEKQNKVIDKIELLVLGGTWSHYPKQYQEEFIRDTYYSANIYYTRSDRKKLSLEEEITINQNTECRIIGLTLETRPDCINLKEIIKFRRFNCTRLQLGVQHINDNILKEINRRCYNKDTIKALNLLKKNCYKVDYHLMPDLPTSTYEEDKLMFDKILGVNYIKKYHNFKLIEIYILIFINLILIFYDYKLIILNIILILFKNDNFVIYNLKHPELQADQWKIYPTEVTRWTEIKKRYDNGDFKPWSEDIDTNGRMKIINLILHVKENVFPWIRFNRVIRDFPASEIYGGNSNMSLRDTLKKYLEDDGKYCKCIRCREIGNKIIEGKVSINDFKLIVRKYNDVDATEYFISYETNDEKTIYGFCRLRINFNNDNVLPILHDCALVRELHVYGFMTPHNSNEKSTQHIGLGKKMMKKAEELAYFYNGFKKIAVISGVGVRQYYEKLGYKLNDNFMIKDLTFFNQNHIYI